MATSNSMAAVAAAWDKETGNDTPGDKEDSASQVGWPSGFNRNSDVFPTSFPGDPVFSPPKTKHGSKGQAEVKSGLS